MFRQVFAHIGNICGFCCCSYTQIDSSNLGMVQRFGKFTHSILPGLHYFNPCTESIKPISLQTRIITIPKQSVYTKDNMNLHIQTAIFYRICDPFQATYIVNDIVQSIVQLTFATLRTVCGQYVLQQILTKRLEVNAKIEEFVRNQSKNWGVHIQFLLIKDLSLDSYLADNLNIVSKAKRITQAKIIQAKAILESAKLYREAADTLDSKAAIQIRYLDTLQQMDKMRASKYTIIPLQPDYNQ